MANVKFTQENLTPQTATSADLCALLHCSHVTLRRMELDGRIPPAIRVGRRKLWPAEAIAKLLLGTDRLEVHK